MGDQHVWSETNMPDWILTFLIGDPSDSGMSYPETGMSDKRPAYLIRDWPAWLKTDMPDRRPIGDRHPWSSMSNGFLMRHFCLRLSMFVLVEACGSLIRHFSLRWGMSASDEACRPPMRHVSLRWGMSTSDEACRPPMRYAGLRWGMLVFDETSLFPIRQCSRN